MATATKTKKAASKSAPVAKSAVPADSALHDFFKDEVKDIYWAEKHLIKVLPKMKKAATSPELATALDEHLAQTKVHVERLEKVFELLDQKPRAKKCEAMEGITKEGEGILEETEAGTATRDVGIILAAQKVEHYEIATYGGLAQLAKTLGLDEIKEILGQTLSEEKETDEKLTAIAENSVNYASASEEE